MQMETRNALWTNIFQHVVFHLSSVNLDFACYCPYQTSTLIFSFFPVVLCDNCYIYIIFNILVYTAASFPFTGTKYPPDGNGNENVTWKWICAISSHRYNSTSFDLSNTFVGEFFWGVIRTKPYANSKNLKRIFFSSLLRPQNMKLGLIKLRFPSVGNLGMSPQSIAQKPKYRYVTIDPLSRSARRNEISVSIRCEQKHYPKWFRQWHYSYMAYAVTIVVSFSSLFSESKGGFRLVNIQCISTYSKIKV